MLVFTLWARTSECFFLSYTPGQKSLEQYYNIYIFSVIYWFPLKTVHPFQNFFAVLSTPTLYKVETRKRILDTRVQHCLWGEGRGWTCVNWKTPQKQKSVPRLLSMIVDARKMFETWAIVKNTYFKAKTLNLTKTLSPFVFLGVIFSVK